ncbi:MAG: cobyric acid synthase [Actinobacteria bacterium]|nr:cobyric acid synthase [Actinomycetota bacterium]
MKSNLDLPQSLSLLNKGALMVGGTGSDVGKSMVVTGLCRMLSQKGFSVAPFKAQNMALNSFATIDGDEIARAQAIQAFAANAEAQVLMNPVLLKPVSHTSCQVVVMGKPLGDMNVSSYQGLKDSLLKTSNEALAELMNRFDVVICEGAGSVAEINLFDTDIVNLRICHVAGIPSVIVANIDKGGVFASLYGTVSLLPGIWRSTVKGFIINKFRGDFALLESGLSELYRLCGIPTIAVLPYLEGLMLEAEDSLGLEQLSRYAETALVGVPAGAKGAETSGDILEIAVVAFPHIANFTDFYPLSIEPYVSLKIATSPTQLLGADLIVLPGSKSTALDLDWLKDRGIDKAIRQAMVDKGAVVLGICAGYQMLGSVIFDEVESKMGELNGLGLLDVHTVFEKDKVVRQVKGHAKVAEQPQIENQILFNGQELYGYEIHHGRVTLGSSAAPWIILDNDMKSVAGALDGSKQVFGTSVHGIFESDSFRRAFLQEVAKIRNKSFISGAMCYQSIRDAQFDLLAQVLEKHLDFSSQL